MLVFTMVAVVAHLGAFQAALFGVVVPGLMVQ
jgi:hypothetical protein